ncbi:YhcN/YlaJ family sporulation lipoprotein [Sutcliffiella halmapala]|uniref:YhcN/YlaJ family sporulation lipoprotein n=1 Tax=Sutcliffiella halmapala TaxID=79882 RepID=UPI000995DBC9|nr:YhcN/YlaJ family sporulation lipoprotein [Sutcliffiella halmapala]
MNVKGLVVTGLAFTMLATGCGNVNEYDTAGRDAPNDSLNVNYEQGDRFTGTRNVRNNTVNPRRVNDRNEPRLAIADRAADKITDLNEVRSCNVVVTNRNAYVAAVLENGNQDEVTREVERKIADQVKATDSNIRNVYVSVNPEFVDRMDGYANDLREGRPIGGFFDEFTETIERIFPTNR